MGSYSFAEMADVAEADVIGKRQRLEIVRARAAKGQWPETDIRQKEAALPVFEEIARRLRAQAEREAANK